MKRLSPNSKLNTQIYAEACEWLVHFRAGDADDDANVRRELDEWLRRSPEHVRAYLEVSTIWEDAALHDPEHRIDAEAHVARALADSNIFSLGPTDPTSAGAPAAASRKWRWPLAVAASLIVVMVTAGALGWLMLRPSIYATELGEHRTLTLDDGSTIALNARSRIRVRYTEQERSVSLLEGQALFRVAKDTTRPFVVLVDDTRLRAVGTQFDVNRRNSATTVTVIEGKVSVDAPAPLRLAVTPDPASVADPVVPPVREVLLVAGEQITVTPEAVMLPKPANLVAATAWTQQRLVFDSAPLSDVVEEFNRYNKRPMIIRDEELASFGVIGVFSSTEPASLLTFLRSQPEIDVIEQTSEIGIARR